MSETNLNTVAFSLPSEALAVQRLAAFRLANLAIVELLDKGFAPHSPEVIVANQDADNILK